MEPDASLPAVENATGDGTISGLILRSANMPVNPTIVEKTKPGLVRSRRYQRNGLVSESVRET